MKFGSQSQLQYRSSWHCFLGFVVVDPVVLFGLAVIAELELVVALEVGFALVVLGLGQMQVDLLNLQQGLGE